MTQNLTLDFLIRGICLMRGDLFLSTHCSCLKSMGTASAAGIISTALSESRREGVAFGRGMNRREG